MNPELYISTLIVTMSRYFPANISSIIYFLAVIELRAVHLTHCHY